MLTVIAVLLYAGYTKSIPLLGGGGVEVTARVADATHVQKGNAVRVAGVDVGRVEDVALAGSGRGAVITMRIEDDKGVEVRDDARVAVWWRTLLGRNMYLELDPGSPSAPLLGDREIPMSHTEVQQEADQVLEPLGETQRASVQKIIASFDDAAGDPQSIGDSIMALGPATENLRRGLPALRGTRPGDLERLVREASRTLGALGRSEDDLAGLVDHGRTALGVTAARSGDLGSTLEQAPSTMDDTRVTLARLRRTLDALDPVAERLLPGARRLKRATTTARPMLARLDTVLGQAERPLRDLRPAVLRLSEAATPGKAIIDDLRPTVDRANRTLLPWLEETDRDTKLRTYAAIGPFFAAMGSASSPFDANGYMFNFQSAPDERTPATVPCTTRLTDPGESQTAKLRCDAMGDLAQILGGKR